MLVLQRVGVFVRDRAKVARRDVVVGANDQEAAAVEVLETQHEPAENAVEQRAVGVVLADHALRHRAQNEW